MKKCGGNTARIITPPPPSPVYGRGPDNYLESSLSKFLGHSLVGYGLTPTHWRSGRVWKSGGKSGGCRACHFSLFRYHLEMGIQISNKKRQSTFRKRITSQATPINHLALIVRGGCRPETLFARILVHVEREVSTAKWAPGDFFWVHMQEFLRAMFWTILVWVGMKSKFWFSSARQKRCPAVSKEPLGLCTVRGWHWFDRQCMQTCEAGLVQRRPAAGGVGALVDLWKGVAEKKIQSRTGSNIDLVTESNKTN